MTRGTKATGPPRLRRAVAEATDPYSAETNALLSSGSLVEFLLNRRTTDAAYEAIIR